MHALAHLGARHATRKAAARGGSASTSTANLLSHEDQAASAPAAAAPGGQSMRRLRRPNTPAGDVEATGSAAGTPRAGGRGDAGVAPSAGSSSSASLCGQAGEGSQGGSGSGEDLARGLSSAALELAEPCDAVTSAVVAASCPDTVVGGDGAKPPGEVRLPAHAVGLPAVSP